MVVDTSALASILLGEPDARRTAQAIQAAPVRVISAASYPEFGILARTRRGYGAAVVDAVLQGWVISVVPVSATQARLALEAFVRYGKGQHPARLNFGDCLVCALAKERGEPLLFKGNDFSRTDVTPAI